MNMRVLFTVAVLLLLGACSGGEGKLDIRTPQDANNDGVQDTTLGIKQWISEETTESALIAEDAATAVKSVANASNDACPETKSTAEVAALSELGEQAYYRSQEMCHLFAGVDRLMARAMKQPTTVQGEVAAQAFGAVAVVEETDAQEAVAKNSSVRSGLGIFGWIGGAYIIGNAISDVSSNAGNEYNVTGNDMRQSNSINDSGFGEGGSGSLGDGNRSNSIHIGEGDDLRTDMTGAISSQAQVNGGAAEKNTAQEATGDAMVNDADNVSDNKAGISPF